MKTRSPTLRLIRPRAAWGRALLTALAAAIPVVVIGQPSGVESCRTNLNRIFEALQEYRKDHQAWPDNLSDLHPVYISDITRFTCPEVHRLGVDNTAQLKLRPEPFSDRLPISRAYSYEFRPSQYPLWAGVVSTDREFKERQMKLIGSKVPIVRCVAHRPGLFLSVGGTIFETSHVDWEDTFKDVVDPKELYPHRVFRDLAPIPGRFTNGIVPRNPATEASLIDLSRHYTSAMHAPWLWRNSGNDLSEVPQGTVQLASVTVRFDVRGVIQLASTNMVSPFPERADGIAVGQKSHFLNFLEGAVLGEPITTRRRPDPVGTEIGRYEIHYADGQHLRIAIHYGVDLLVWDDTDQPPNELGERIAWQGENRMSKGNPIRLYHQRWENPRPDIAIQSFDFVSSMAGTAPFLIAVTLEP